MEIVQILINIFNRIAPIILLLLIGRWLNNKHFLTVETVAEIKKLVVNLALPAVLFTSFLTMEIKPAFFWFVPLMLLTETALYLVGLQLQNHLKVRSEYFPFLTTGFEYGMTGVSLFAAAFGLDQLGKIAIIDFGQELFVWFIYLALLARKREGSVDPKSLLKMFISSPVILAIIAGIGLNLIGFASKLSEIPFIPGLLNTIDLIGSLTIPLILIVVGYGIQLDQEEFKYSLRVILIRLGILIPYAFLINYYFIYGWLGLDRGFQAAFFTMMILPPPFILTLFMDQNKVDEQHSIDNTLTLHTIVTIVVFIVYFGATQLI